MDLVEATFAQGAGVGDLGPFDDAVEAEQVIAPRDLAALVDLLEANVAVVLCGRFSFLARDGSRSKMPRTACGRCR